MKRPSSRPVRRTEPPTSDLVRFSCPCGAALRIPASRVGGHGICPKCRRRLLLGAPPRSGSPTRIRPKELGDSDPSGQTFLIEAPFRIEDHFREIQAPPPRIGFRCPCGRKLATSGGNVEKRARCPHCGARLLLAGKTHPRTGKLEIHPLALDVPSSGDTMILDG